MYQGNLSLILDNSALDAPVVFDLTARTRRNRRMTTCGPERPFGGPLQIPHLLHGKAVLRELPDYTQPNDNTATSLMPDQAMRSGDFAQADYRSEQWQPFPGDAIPASRMAPQSHGAVEVYPLPNFPESAGYKLPGSAGGHQPTRTTCRGRQQDVQPEAPL